MLIDYLGSTDCMLPEYAPNLLSQQDKAEIQQLSQTNMITSYKHLRPPDPVLRMIRPRSTSCWKAYNRHDNRYFIERTRR